MRILFTCAGRRGYLFQYFREASVGAEILAADADRHASALLQADRAFIVPPLDSPEYPRAVVELCSRERVDMLFSLHDYDLPRLAAIRGEIEATGTRAFISPPAVIATCLDKLHTFEFLRRSGLPSPESWPATEAIARAARGEVDFPLFVKPRSGSASIDVSRVDDAAALRAAVGTRDDMLAQECLTGEEYGIDVLNDLEGRVIAVTVKRKLAMRSGETDKSVTVKDPALIELGRATGAALGHVGNLDMDVFVTASGPRVLELNPRFGGGYPGSHVAGARYPEKLVKVVIAAREGRSGAGATPAPLDDYEAGVYCMKSIAPLAGRAADFERYHREKGAAS